FHSEIHLVYVCKNGNTEWNLENHILDRYPGHLIITKVLHSPDPALAMQQYIHEHNIDMMAIRPGKRTLFTEFNCENTTTALVSLLDIPILVLNTHNQQTWS